MSEEVQFQAAGQQHLILNGRMSSMKVKFRYGLYQWPEYQNIEHLYKHKSPF